MGHRQSKGADPQTIDKGLHLFVFNNQSHPVFIVLEIGIDTAGQEALRNLGQRWRCHVVDKVACLLIGGMRHQHIYPVFPGHAGSGVLHAGGMQLHAVDFEPVILQRLEQAKANKQHHQQERHGTGNRCRLQRL